MGLGSCECMSSDRAGPGSPDDVLQALRCLVLSSESVLFLGGLFLCGRQGHQQGSRSSPAHSSIRKTFFLPNAIVPAEPDTWFHWTISGERLPIPESIATAGNIEPGLGHVLQLQSWRSREWGQCHVNLVDED